jgi:hypothetical protein
MIDAGIPTAFNGTRYRSRLEARWGAFFNLLKWDAHYEPFDLNGYIPDFILHGRKQRILVEVKPVASDDDVLFQMATEKIAKSGWKDDALIVSYFLPRHDDDPAIGWLGEYMDHCNDFCWALAPFTDADGGLGFCHEYQCYCNRITGVNEHSYSLKSSAQIESRWLKAGNAVQWRAP